MTWTINGVDPRTAYGLTMSQVTGWQDDVAEKYPTVAVPGIPGLVRTSATPVVDARRLVGTGTVVGVGASSAARIADARAKLDNLRALFAGKGLTVVMNDRPTQQLTCDCEGIVVTPESAQMVAERIGVTISLVAIDPYYYDTAQTTVTNGAAIALGTAPTRPVITTTFTSGAAGQNIFIQNAAGTVTYATLLVTWTFVAGDVLVVDCAARTVTLNGVARLDIISGGDFFALDVATMGDFLGNVMPKFTAAWSASLTYRRAWR